MSEQHTPGPLSIHQAFRKTDGGFDWAIRDKDGKVIGDARPACDNARLWAAAPDLLAALENMLTVNCDDAKRDGFELGTDEHNAEIQARAAIAKGTKS